MTRGRLIAATAIAAALGALPVQSYTTRGVGLIASVDDVGDIVVVQQRGVPIRVRDVAEVSIGHAPRLGVVGFDAADDVVQGIVLMRYGAETKATLDGVYRRLAFIRENHLLPPGMEVVPYYDRAALIRLTTRTVMENLLEGMALVTVVLVLFLGSARAALVTAINIPLALLVAFIGMVASGTPANLISLGAVDFGIVVDSTVIMGENLFRHPGAHGHGSIYARVRAAAAEVGRPMAFSTLIIGVAFLPLFTMRGVSGVIFGPMALTYGFAIAGAILLALTLTPSSPRASSPPRRRSGTRSSCGRCRASTTRSSTSRCGGRASPPSRPLLFVALTVGLFPLLGSEYMPKLEEGNFWIRATLPKSISLEEAARHVGKLRAVLRAHPEVVSVVSQLGRPDDGTDVAGFYNVELFAPLKAYDAWPRGVTKEKLTEQLAGELDEVLPAPFSTSRSTSPTTSRRRSPA